MFGEVTMRLCNNRDGTSLALARIPELPESLV